VDTTAGGPGSLVVDLDGVLYRGAVGIPGAGRALETLRDRGFRIVFVTNNSRMTPDTVARHIEERTGFPADPATVVTSGMATAAALRGKVSRALVLGGAGLVRLLDEAGISVTTDPEAAEAVVVALDLDLTYRRLADAVQAILGGATFVATGTDRTFPMPDGLYPGAGAIVAAVRTATGVEPLVCGKPHPPTCRLVAGLLGAEPVWMVGDRPETDLAMAAAMGWRKVLVLSGVTEDASGVPGRYRPDLVLDSIARLPQAIGGPTGAR